jgi:hypothetical protein
MSKLSPTVGFFFLESTSCVRDLASRIARTTGLPETGYFRVPKPLGKPRFAVDKVFVERCTRQIAPTIDTRQSRPMRRVPKILTYMMF